MDITYWIMPLGFSCIAFLFGVGVGGLIVAQRAEARRIASLGDEEQELGI